VNASVECGRGGQIQACRGDVNESQRLHGGVREVLGLVEWDGAVAGSGARGGDWVCAK